MKTFILVIMTWGFVAFLSPAVLASEWKANCGNQTVKSLNEKSVACIVPTGATDHGEIIDTKGCENIDMGMTEDADGDGVGGPAFTATAQWCPVSETDATVDTAGERTLACVDYASGTLTGNGTLQGIGVPSGRFRVEVGGTHAGDPEVWIKCNP